MDGRKIERLNSLIFAVKDRTLGAGGILRFYMPPIPGAASTRAGASFSFLFAIEGPDSKPVNAGSKYKVQAGPEPCRVSRKPYVPS